MYNMEGKFVAQDFLTQLLDQQGKECKYNGTKEYFDSRPPLPKYFDEKKIKRAQEFFEENIMSLMTISMAGLILLMSDPRGIELLMATKKSSEPLTAYKRYRDTSQHVVSWYRGEFREGSKLWKSLMTVRRMHSAADMLAEKQGIRGVDQGAMSITLFGFFGLGLSRQKEFGLASASDEDLEALVHFWRVIGYMTGVEDEFNICRESLDETRSICETITEHAIQPLLNKHEESLMLQFAALDGTNMVIPGPDSKVFMNFIYSLVMKEEEHGECFYPLSFTQKLQLKTFMKTLELCQFHFMRSLANFQTRYTIYLMQMYPEMVEHEIRGTDLLTYI